MPAIASGNRCINKAASCSEVEGPNREVLRTAERGKRTAKSESFQSIRNGLLARSSPMVVSGPCPGTTMVSSGSASTGPCNDCMIFS